MEGHLFLIQWENINIGTKKLINCTNMNNTRPLRQEHPDLKGPRNSTNTPQNTKLTHLKPHLPSFLSSSVHLLNLNDKVKEILPVTHPHRCYIYCTRAMTVLYQHQTMDSPERKITKLMSNHCLVIRHVR